MEKVCFKCGENKALTDFYKHSQMKDGHLNKCKCCAKRDVHKHRDDNIERVRAYDRARGSRQSAESLREYRAANPIKYAAHLLLNNRLRDGKLVKPDLCESCGECGEHRRLHGHHDDYAKPLEVRWLCPACHHKWHSENGEGLNAN
jgi:hypothetical protein